MTLSVIRKQSTIQQSNNQQSNIDKIVKSIETRVIHGLELPIQAQDLAKAYHTSTCFRDIYHYIAEGRLPSSTKVQNCICAEAFNCIVVNNLLFRIDTQKDKNRDKGNTFLLQTYYSPHTL